jgi:hypothetical protein
MLFQTRETIAARVRLKLRPFPAWRPDLPSMPGPITGFATGPAAAVGRHRLADFLVDCEPAVVLDGKHAAGVGGIDTLALFPRDGVVVVGSCFLRANAVVDELLPGDPTSGPATKVWRYASELRTRLRQLLHEVDRSRKLVILDGGSEDAASSDAATPVSTLEVAGDANKAGDATKGGAAAVVAGGPASTEAEHAPLSVHASDRLSVMRDGSMFSEEHQRLLASETTTFHYVYISSTETDEDTMTRYRSRMTDDEWIHTWFASFADFSTFHLPIPARGPPATTVGASAIAAASGTTPVPCVDGVAFGDTPTAALLWPVLIAVVVVMCGAWWHHQRG